VLALGVTPGERVYPLIQLDAARDVPGSEKPNRVRMRARLDMPPHDEMHLFGDYF
jgi:hypothetical protein